MQAIEAFQKDPPTTVFLLSMRAGSVGINLTAASHVFLLEPCINPALEEQVRVLAGKGAYLAQAFPLVHSSMGLPANLQDLLRRRRYLQLQPSRQSFVVLTHKSSCQDVST